MLPTALQLVGVAELRLQRLKQSPEELQEQLAGLEPYAMTVKQYLAAQGEFLIVPLYTANLSKAFVYHLKRQRFLQTGLKVAHVLA